jgi:hypothetical protein
MKLELFIALTIAALATFVPSATSQSPAVVAARMADSANWPFCYVVNATGNDTDDNETDAPTNQSATASPSVTETTTLAPDTPEPETPVPATPVPATPEPATPEPATPVPATPEPATPVPATPEPATPVPATPEPATPEPATPVPETPVPATPVPATPVPETPVPATPVPETPVPTTPEPATPTPVPPTLVPATPSVTSEAPSSFVPSSTPAPTDLTLPPVTSPPSATSYDFRGAVQLSGSSWQAVLEDADGRSNLGEGLRRDISAIMLVPEDSVDVLSLTATGDSLVFAFGIRSGAGRSAADYLRSFGGAGTTTLWLVNALAAYRQVSSDQVLVLSTGVAFAVTDPPPSAAVAHSLFATVSAALAALIISQRL